MFCPFIFLNLSAFLLSKLPFYSILSRLKSSLSVTMAQFSLNPIYFIPHLSVPSPQDQHMLFATCSISRPLYLYSIGLWPFIFLDLNGYLLSKLPFHSIISRLKSSLPVMMAQIPLKFHIHHPSSISFISHQVLCP